MKGWLILFGGFAVLGFGVWLLTHMIKETREGYRSRFGNDIGLYIWAIACIIIGIILIWQEAF